MTTFQAVVHAILGAFFEFIPVSSRAIHHFVSSAFDWPEINAPILGAIHLGLFLALLVAFRHDLLSLVSSFLQVVLLRRKPRSIDEKLPFFLLLTLLIPGALWATTRDMVANFYDQPLVFIAIFGLSGLPLWFVESRSKRNKTHYDWNAVDAILLGLGSAAFLFPSVGRTTGAYFFTTMRNFSKDGATRFILFSATPMLGASAYWHLAGLDVYSFAPVDVSHLTLGVTGVVAFVCGLFAIRGVQHQMARVNLSRYAIYRVLIGAVALGALYFQGKLG